MSSIRYVLLSDGSSDTMLMPVLDWLLHRQCPRYALDSQWSTWGGFPNDQRSYRTGSKRL